MTTRSRLDLRELVREVMADKFIGPEAVAAEVLRRVPEEDYRDALAQTLHLFARVVIGQERAKHRRQPPPKPRKGHGKAGQIREAWRLVLEQRLNENLHVDGAWKRQRDCTFDDLMAVAAERYDQAKRNTAMAAVYEGRAHLVQQYGVATFGDLPTDVLLQELGVTR